MLQDLIVLQLFLKELAMIKGILIFVIGAAVGIGASVVANTPLDPFHDWIVEVECESHYAKELGISRHEFVQVLNQVKNANKPPHH
jgi:hypothetical protein